MLFNVSLDGSNTHEVHLFYICKPNLVELTKANLSVTSKIAASDCTIIPRCIFCIYWDNIFSQSSLYIVRNVTVYTCHFVDTSSKYIMIKYTFSIITYEDQLPAADDNYCSWRNVRKEITFFKCLKLTTTWIGQLSIALQNWGTIMNDTFNFGINYTASIETVLKASHMRQEN